MSEAEKIEAFCNRNAAIIPVIETVGDVRGNYFLSELPEELREKWVKQFCEEGRTPIVKTEI